MTTIPTLSNIFPKLWTQLERLSHELEIGIYAEWSLLTARLAFLNDLDLIDLIDAHIPGWHKIATKGRGITAHHTILVLATCRNLPEYKDKSPQTQSEIQWAALLHGY